MRFTEEKAIVALGAFVLVGSFVLLARLIQRSQKRKSMRDDAIAALRESGEHFLPADETNPAGALTASESQ